jgi:putative membrane protein
MAVSATWELFEWASAVVGGSAADDFLGAQGDIWDTQWDMFMAAIGAILSLVLLSRVHDRQLRDVTATTGGMRLPPGGPA